MTTKLTLNDLLRIPEEQIETKGISYVQQYFQYSILENYNARVDDAMIVERENWWKDTLQTRKFGYNDN